MSVDLHTRGRGNSSLPHDSLSTDHTHSNNFNGSDSNPQLLISRDFGSHTCSTPLPHSTEAHSPPHQNLKHNYNYTHHHIQMPLHHHHHHQFDSSCIGSDDWDSMNPWDSISSWSQSSLWSPLCSNQGSSEGSLSPKESSGFESTYDVVGMFENMKLDQSGSSKHHLGVCSSHQSLLQQQFQANQLSLLKQEQVMLLKQKLTAYRENHSHTSLQFQNKVKEVPIVAPPPQQRHSPPHEKQQIFRGTTVSRGTSCGTGVFLPRGGISIMPDSHSRRQGGKGCSTVLIPERVVQALQLHFDQIAATSGPKPRGFPPLHDVLVSNRNGMYSLQKRQSRKKPTHVQNEMILPRDWTY